MGVSSVCVEEGERRSEEELGARRRSVGRSVGRSVVGHRSAAGAAPKVRTPHNDVGNNPYIIWEFPKIRGTFLGFPIIRTVVFWGLYLGPPYYLNAPCLYPLCAP